MNDYFKGKKTIAAGIVVILGSAISYFAGEATLSMAAMAGLNGLVAIVVKKFAEPVSEPVA